MSLPYGTGSGPKAMPSAMPRRFQGCQCAVKPALRPAQGGRRHSDAFQKNRYSGSLPSPEMNADFVNIIRFVVLAA